MVKKLAIIVMSFLAANAWAQNLSLGVGGRASNQWVQNNTDFNFDILDSSSDTLILTTELNSASLINGLSFPIYARFTSKRNWWVQVNYGFETWRLGLDASTAPTNYAVETEVADKIEDLEDPSPDDLEDLTDVYREDVIEDGTTDLQVFERVQYNKLTFAAGSSFNRKGIVTFYYGVGVDFLTASTFESYQGLVYDNDDVTLMHHILEAAPKLNSTLLAPFFNFGIEKQNIRLGLDFSFFPFPVFGEHNDDYDVPPLNTTASTTPNSNQDQLIQNIASVGVTLNYNLFNQNFNQAIAIDKKNVLDPLIIGKYRQKPKLIQYGFALNFPNFHNSGWSNIDNFELSEELSMEINDSLLSKGDDYLTGNLFAEDREIEDFIYLEKQDEEYFVNESGNIDTSFLSTTVFFALGNINSIVKTPKLSGFVRINPHELFSADLQLGYQNHTYGIRAYETIRESTEGESTTQTRKVVYQENFHEASVGTNLYFQKQINNISKLGFHIGVNYNLWFNGTFEEEGGGINDSELLQDFHDYNTGQLDGRGDPSFEEAAEWRGHSSSDDDADKGVFTKQDYYNTTYEGEVLENSYYTDYQPYLLNTWQKRSYVEVRFGVDYYIENLKFNLYAERSIGRYQTMYNNLFTVGMGVALFLD